MSRSPGRAHRMRVGHAGQADRSDCRHAEPVGVAEPIAVTLSGRRGCCRADRGRYPGGAEDHAARREDHEAGRAEDDETGVRLLRELRGGEGGR